GRGSPRAGCWLAASHAPGATADEPQPGNCDRVSMQARCADRMTGEPRDVRAQLTFLGDVRGTPTNYFEVEPPPGAPSLYPRIRREVVVHDARALAAGPS